MKRNPNLVTFAGNPVTIRGRQVVVGNPAKNFVAIGNDLKPVSLSDFKGMVRIISAMPSVDTGVCAAQTRRFNQEAASLPQAQVISISCDLPFAQKRFCASEGIDKAIVVSDHKDTDFGVKYGFLIEEFRLLARGIVVIDKDDTVKYLEIVKEITDHPDYDKALAVVKSLV